MTTTRDSASPIDAADEELIDTLIAISVVAKRLAAKLERVHIKRASKIIASIITDRKIESSLS